MTTLAIGLFVLGIILILVEVVAPGMIFGIVGGVLIAIGVYILVDDPLLSALYIGLIILIMAIVLPIFYRMMKKRGGFRKITQNASLRTEEGFTSRSKNLANYIGENGYALSPLRPSGTVELFDGTRLDVVTRGEFIQSGDKVQIIDVEGTWLIVKRI